MNAVCITAPGRVEMIDVPEPSLGAEDVLIDVRYVGLCGTDLNTYRGLSGLVSYPRIPGHEVSGVVVGKGQSVPERIGLGDAVTLSPYLNCGTCAVCAMGRTNCCPTLQCLGVHRDGALVERLAIHQSKVFPSQALTLQELALVEPFCIGHHAVKRGRVTGQDRVLVIGSGTIGVAVIAAAVEAGARVIACDIDASKLENARKFGAQGTINSAQEDVLRRVEALTYDQGVTVAIEAVGLPQTFRLAVEAVSNAGRVVYVGHPKDAVCYDAELFVRKELDVLGSRNAQDDDFAEVMRAFERREQPFLELVTATYPFGDAGQALSDWAAAPPSYAKILVQR